jgi:hypothetical protein
VQGETAGANIEGRPRGYRCHSPALMPADPRSGLTLGGNLVALLDATDLGA